MKNIPILTDLVAPGPGLLACAGVDACARLQVLMAELEELRALATRDALTGAWNRHHFNQVVAAEVARSERHEQFLSLVLLDLDHFKSVNDTFGHATGDEVLRAFADVLRENTRGGDMVFRWGGEEFAILAPAAGHRAAATLAERVRVAAEEHAFPGVGRLTVCAGVAEHVRGESNEDWLRRADAMLYEAKRNGRNRVRVDPRGDSNRRLGGPAPSILKLQWHEAYESGVPEIDEDHRAMFDQANALLAVALGPDAVEDEVVAALDALLATAEKHFRAEERLLAAMAFPGLARHARAHAALLRRAADLRVQLLGGKASLGTVVDFLAGHLVARHILAMDHEFFPLVKLMPPGAVDA